MTVDAERALVTVSAPLVVLSDDVLVQQVAEETVLLNLRSGLYFILDDVGTVMLDLASSLPTPEAVVEALAGEYEDVSPAILAGDLRRLLDELVAKGLVLRS